MSNRRDTATTEAGVQLASAALTQTVYGPGTPQHRAAHDSAVTALETAFDAGATVDDVHATAELLPGYKPAAA